MNVGIFMGKGSDLAPFVISNHEIASLGVGFAAGLLVGGIIGGTGEFPDGSWVLLGAFVAGASVLFQVRQNALNVEAAKIADWKRQRRRVYDILLAQLTRVISEYEFIMTVRELVTKQLDTSVASFKELLTSVQKQGGESIDRAYKISTTRRRYLPDVHLYYLDENPNCIEYLHSDVVAKLGGIQSRLKKTSEDSRELVHFEVARHGVAMTYDLHEKILSHLKTFRDFVESASHRD
jgi:hypothetical protein